MGSDPPANAVSGAEVVSRQMGFQLRWLGLSRKQMGGYLSFLRKGLMLLSLFLAHDIIPPAATHSSTSFKDIAQRRNLPYVFHNFLRSCLASIGDGGGGARGTEVGSNKLHNC